MPYTSGRVRLYYEVHGQGQPLVLIHANPFDHRLWTYQIASFAQFFTVVAIDIRGYGRSDKPETPFSLRDMAADILEVCTQERISRAVFAGVSVGSGLAMLIGLDHPEMVDALILVGGSSRGGEVGRRIKGYTSPDLPAYHMAHMRELFAPGFFDTVSGRWVQALFGATSLGLSGACIAQIFRARGSCDLTERLHGMKPPTLVINGAHDGSLESGRATASRIPGAQHFVLPATGHACCIEDPHTFDSRMLQFLREM